MQTALVFLNLVVSLVSAVAGVVALIRPATWSGSNDVVSGEMFYARMYAARSIPLGLTAGILPFLRGGSTVAWVLFTATVIQIGDVVIALTKKEPRMATGASIAAIVHFMCGIAIL